ncbi:hypothetical protein BG000_005713, partial [Podila horticola]
SGETCSETCSESYSDEPQSYSGEPQSYSYSDDHFDTDHRDNEHRVDTDYHFGKTFEIGNIVVTSCVQVRSKGRGSLSGSDGKNESQSCSS